MIDHIPKRIQTFLQTLTDNSEPVGGSNHAACICHKNRILTFGTNQNKTHPIAFRYQDHPEKIYLHAEMDAITKFVRRHPENLLTKCTLYVIRFNGEFVNSEPCDACSKLISYYGINKVIHS